MKEGNKKDRRDRSEWRGERCVGRFSQLPTLLWILRFKGLVFFLALRETREEKKNNEINRLGSSWSVRTSNSGATVVNIGTDI